VRTWRFMSNFEVRREARAGEVDALRMGVSGREHAELHCMLVSGRWHFPIVVAQSAATPVSAAAHGAVSAATTTRNGCRLLHGP